MKKLFHLFLLSFFCFQMSAQQVAVSGDKNNVFYIGLDNPITVAVENCSCKDLVVKTNNGSILGKGCILVYRSKEAGRADIIVYKKTGSKIKEIGRNFFRVKRIPPPIFKIGPYGGSYDYNYERKVQKVVLANQHYVRAELENFDINAKFMIDSFSVKIFHADSGKSNVFFNITGKISQQISDAFSDLKKDDILLFNQIFAKGPDGLQWELTPLVLIIDK